MPIIKPQRALSKLVQYLDEIDKLSGMNYYDGENEFDKLNLKVMSFIHNAFDNADEKLQDYNSNVNFLFEVVGSKKSEEEQQKDYLDRLNSMKNFLETYQEELQMLVDNNQAEIETERKSNEVFIIHGHDRATLLDLERMLEQRWSLKTIILMDKPATGRTFIEKFEEEAKKASYAFRYFNP